MIKTASPTTSTNTIAEVRPSAHSLDSTLPSGFRDEYLASSALSKELPNPFKAPEYTTRDRRVPINADSARRGAELHGVIESLENTRGCMQLTIRAGAQGMAGVAASRTAVENDVSTADPSLRTFVVYRNNDKDLIFAPVQHPTQVGESITIKAPRGHLIAGFVSMREPNNAGLVNEPIQRTLINVATVGSGRNVWDKKNSEVVGTLNIYGGGLSTSESNRGAVGLNQQVSGSFDELFRKR
jgi:hypothetical protein